MAGAPLPKNLVEAIIYFSDPNRAFDFVVKMRWADGKVICPRCEHDETSFLSTRRIWKCKGCRKQFSLSRGEYVSGIVHTNGIENYWSLLKRSLKGS